MTSSSDRVLEEVGRLAAAAAQEVEDTWQAELRPQLARLLAQSATVAIRAAAGEDVTTAKLALDASLKNLTRAQQSIVALQGRVLALRAALSIITKLATA